MQEIEVKVLNIDQEVIREKLKKLGAQFRSYYSVWDLIGQVGGIFEILEITCAIFVGIYNSKVMEYEMTNEYSKASIHGSDNTTPGFGYLDLLESVL